MANRRIAVHEIRNVIVRMRLGDSDRQLASAKIIGRHKAAEIRALAKQKGWLDREVELPDNLELEAVFQKPFRKQVTGSLVEPFSEQVKKWIDADVSATVIHRNLILNFDRSSLGILMPLHRPNPWFFLMPSCCGLGRRSTGYALRSHRYLLTVTVDRSLQIEVRTLR